MARDAKEAQQKNLMLVHKLWYDCEERSIVDTAKTTICRSQSATRGQHLRSGNWLSCCKSKTRPCCGMTWTSKLVCLGLVSIVLS